MVQQRQQPTKTCPTRTLYFFSGTRFLSFEIFRRLPFMTIETDPSVHETVSTPGAALRIDSRFRNVRPMDVRTVRIIIIVPPRTPSIICRAHDNRAQSSFCVAIAKHEGGVMVVAIGRKLLAFGGVSIIDHRVDA